MAAAHSMWVGQFRVDDRPHWFWTKMAQCGAAKLAGDGHDTRSIQDYLGHTNIQHTVRYTELSPTRFKDFWLD